MNNKIGNMENRFGLSIKRLGLKEVVVPELPGEDQFCHFYDEDGICTERGTWGKILGYRHLAGEHKWRRQERVVPVEWKYYDPQFTRDFDKRIFEAYDSTGDIKVIEEWWDA